MMAEIEKQLHEVHAAARARAAETTPHGDTPLSTNPAEQSVRGFAMVNSVAQGSPAAMAVHIIELLELSEYTTSIGY